MAAATPAGLEGVEDVAADSGLPPVEDGHQNRLIALSELIVPTLGPFWTDYSTLISPSSITL